MKVNNSSQTKLAVDEYKYTRCVKCGVRIPEYMMMRHLVEKHEMNYGSGLPAFVLDGTSLAFNKGEEK